LLGLFAILLEAQKEILVRTAVTIEPADAANYIKQYVEAYRREYRRFSSPPPTGGGYPDIKVSPYLYSSELTCYLANDGGAIADFSWQPAYQWDIAGGPTLLVDFPETRTPPKIVAQLKELGLSGKPIGIYRIVSQDGFSNEVWNGLLPQPTATAESRIDHTRIVVFRYDLDWQSLIQRLTFGAFCKILDLRLPAANSDFWTPRIIRNLGFATADREHKRFYHYLELFPHTGEGAWDVRSIWARVHVDIRRDYASTIGSQGQGGGYIAFNNPEAPINLFYDRVSALKQAIDEFETLLKESGDLEESVFHNFLNRNPVLIDVYGEPLSKPRFTYPSGESPLGKEYVEPDFIVRYPGDSYKLIELERPNKMIATKQGQPRAELTQAAFQIAEWKTYIANHYERLKDTFPGISVKCSTMIVISRAHEMTFGEGRDIRRYMELVKNQFSADEVLLYDDLLDRAKQAYIRLSTLTIERKG
jgi:hypothetical protein